MPNKSDPLSEKIDVVAFEDHDGHWIAQGIQYDIVARAKSVAAIREAFSRQLAANLALNGRMGRNGLEGIPAAPERFRRMFEEANEAMRPVRSREDIDIRLVEAA